ncbi:MAG: response regulator [Campylobacterota bacterium]|nr:response regulator [Campylobacterota bacterium]
MNILKKLREKAKFFSILCVEDEEELRESVVIFLKKFFKNVEYAEDGVQGLQKYNDNHYDIVLTDIEMPNMDGLELSKEIKSINQDTQVIVLSAFDNKEYLLEAIEIGIDHYIVKPIDRDFMVTTLIKGLETLELKEELEKQREVIMNQSRNSSMSDMLFCISHHWRQPLNAVGVAIQSLPLMYEFGTLDKEYLDKQVKESMEIIQDLSNSLNQFSSLFDSSSKETFNPIVAIDEISLLLIDVFKNNGIDITYLFDNKDEIYKANIKGDINEFKQVILAILNNAKEAIHSAKEDGKIDKGKINFNFIDKDNSIEIIIEDNGGGVNSEVLDNIFDPFFTTHDIANKKGLGLYISKMIISKKMGGDLILKNETKGLQTIISLPKL